MVHCANISNSVCWAPEMQLIFFRGGVVFQEDHFCTERDILAFLIHFHDDIPLDVKGRVIKCSIVTGLEQSKVADRMKEFCVTFNRQDALR